MVRHVLFKHDGEAVQCGFPVLNGPQSRSAVFPRGWPWLPCKCCAGPRQPSCEISSPRNSGCSAHCLQKSQQHARSIALRANFFSQNPLSRYLAEPISRYREQRFGSTVNLFTLLRSTHRCGNTTSRRRCRRIVYAGARGTKRRIRSIGPRHGFASSWQQAIKWLAWL